MAAYRGVIFDVDGTLVDSNAAHARAWVEALGEHGHHVTLERVRRLIGMGSDQLLPEVTGLTKDSPEGEQIASRRGAIFKQRYLPTLRPLPGARALVARLRADGVKLVVAALERLALAAEETVMIGDTPYDVEAAGKAGVRVIGLRSGGWDDAGLRGALAVYDHPADLLAHYAASPLGSGA